MRSVFNKLFTIGVQNLDHEKSGQVESIQGHRWSRCIQNRSSSLRISNEVRSWVKISNRVGHMERQKRT